MEQITILTWVIGIGFTFIFALMLVMWNGLNKRMDRIESRMDRLESQILDIDRRLCRIEGIMSTKECCVLTDKQSNEKSVS